MGILLALTALICWSVGDFLIQKSARAFGDWISLFFIDLIGTIGLLPFVMQNVPGLTYSEILFLLIPSATITIAALLEFEALKVGKISVIEPVNTLELPITVLLSTFIAHELLTRSQIFLIIALIAGIFLVSTRSFHHFKNIHAERGVFLAAVAMIAMGTTNFLFGIGARATDPIMINWFTSAFTALFCAAYLTVKGKWAETAKDWVSRKYLILSVGVVDNLAWLCFAGAMLYLPIAIATGITESYVAFAALLGVLLNKERLGVHQWLGLGLTAFAAVMLGLSSG